jgi:hypothetical protein
MTKRLTLVLALLLAVTGLHPALAQTSEPAPTPTPDAHTFTDAAMTFSAPPDAVLLARQPLGPNELGQDLQTVAAWVLHPGQEDARTIQIAMEAYNGAPEQWEGQFESQTHNSQDGTLIRNKTPMSLLNGMPAYFVEIAYGSGFDARKEYAIVWADGERGVVLSETSRLGDSSAEEAKKVLKQVTAVRYPLYEP